MRSSGIASRARWSTLRTSASERSWLFDDLEVFYKPAAPVLSRRSDEPGGVRTKDDSSSRNLTVHRIDLAHSGTPFGPKSDFH